MHLITLNQHKMIKSKPFQHLSAILNLAPAMKYKGNNTCEESGHCKAYCLQNTGHNRFLTAFMARERRTKLYYDDQRSFLALLRGDLVSLINKAKKENIKPTFRFNGLSDIAIEQDIPEIFQEFSDIQFIDYTKRYVRLFQEQPSNYHLCYSINERTPKGIIKDIYNKTRFHACMVFNKDLPLNVAIDDQYFRVIDGDISDLRYLDPFVVGGYPAIVGLRYKRAFSQKTGKSMKVKPGFINLIGA